MILGAIFGYLVVWGGSLWYSIWVSASRRRRAHWAPTQPHLHRPCLTDLVAKVLHLLTHHTPHHVKRVIRECLTDLVAKRAALGGCLAILRAELTAAAAPTAAGAPPGGASADELVRRPASVRLSTR